jgi:dsRNA-specific ribonuclease
MTDNQREIEHKLVGTMITQQNIDSVQKKIGYEFKCKTWLIEALTHKSAID